MARFVLVVVSRDGQPLPPENQLHLDPDIFDSREEAQQVKAMFDSDDHDPWYIDIQELTRFTCTP